MTIGPGPAKDLHRPPNPAPVPEQVPRLLVIALSPGPSPWDGVVAALSEALGLEPLHEEGPAAPDDPELVDRVLERAASSAGPVLVLPPAGEAGTPPGETRTLGQVLAPFDSDEVTAALRPVLARLQASGVEVAQLLVATPETLPPMWEGPGHHARAWHAELRRRHQVGEASVEVAAGVPAAMVLARAGDADLVVLCWSRRVRVGGRLTLRGVLGAVDVPLLLVPVT